MRVREPASVHASLQACTDLVHACTYDCTPAQTSCTHAHRFASQHATVHTSTGLVQASHVALHACSRVCMHARGRCTHANTTASQHSLMQACKSLCKRARRYASLHRPRARMHVTLHARTSPLQACTRYVQACRTACSLASHVCIDTRRTFSVKGTPTPPDSVVPLLFFFLIDKLFLLELFLGA